MIIWLPSVPFTNNHKIKIKITKNFLLSNPHRSLWNLVPRGRTKVNRSAVRFRPWGGRSRRKSSACCPSPSGVRLRPLRTKVNRSAVRFRPWGGRSRRKSSVRRPSPSGVRLRPRTAVPVPRPLAQTAVWLLWHVNHYINATPTRKLPLL